MQSAHRLDWKIPLALLALSAIPCAAGMARLLSLSHPAALPGPGDRFGAAPLTTLLHIVSASLFSILGALQFSGSLRLRYPRWHPACGRVVAASGVLAALSGMWMTVVFRIPPALQGSLLYSVRLLAGTAMLVALVLAVVAVLQRDLAAHRAWMLRGYALGQGAGTQVLLLLPWMLTRGPPTAWQRDLLMSLAWLLNLCVAELLIPKRPWRTLRFFNPARLPPDRALTLETSAPCTPLQPLRP